MLFKNVVAQFIGRVCLMNQATTKMNGKNKTKQPSKRKGVKNGEGIQSKQKTEY
jgi:hypothetical protein